MVGFTPQTKLGFALTSTPSPEERLGAGHQTSSSPAGVRGRNLSPSFEAEVWVLETLIESTEMP